MEFVKCIIADHRSIQRWTRRIYKMQAIMARQNFVAQRLAERIQAHHDETCQNCAAHREAFSWKPSKAATNNEPLPN